MVQGCTMIPDDTDGSVAKIQLAKYALFSRELLSASSPQTLTFALVRNLAFESGGQLCTPVS